MRKSWRSFFRKAQRKARHAAAMSTHPDDSDVVAIIETDRGIIGFEDRTGEETRIEYIVEAPPAKKLKKTKKRTKKTIEEDDAVSISTHRAVWRRNRPRTTITTGHRAFTLSMRPTRKLCACKRLKTTNVLFPSRTPISPKRTKCY